MLAKAVRQASKASSFAEASEDLRELADVEISATHLQRLSERIGEEWAEVRDEEVEKFRKVELERSYKEPPRGAAAVMLDGGRLQTRAEDGGRGASPRAGPSETQGLRLRRPSVQLVDLRDAPSAGGIHRDLGFRSPPGVPLRRGPCLSRFGRGAGMEDVHAVAPLGVVGNRRVKGSEKFWLEGGAEAILQLRAAQLSQDDRWTRNWSRPRKHRRAAGSGRLAQAA